MNEFVRCCDDGRALIRDFTPDCAMGFGRATLPRSRSSGRLQMYNVETGDTLELGEFRLGKYTSGDRRCDLHPRWKPTGDAICFDAIEPTNGTRQLHVAEIRWR